MAKRGRPHKKVTGFKVGHPCYHTKETSTGCNEKKQSKRLPKSVFGKTVQSTSDNRHYVVQDAQGNPGNMRFLRPTADIKCDPEIDDDDDNDINGYKILHCEKLLDMFNEFHQEHSIKSPNCDIRYCFNPETVQKWGFSWRMGLKCASCKFVGKKTKIYKESSRETKRGQKYSTVNLGIHIGLQSSPLGIEGLRVILLSAGIPVPSCSGMHSAGIVASDTTEQVNEEDMQVRRQRLTELNELRGFDKSHPISVSGDARYNNRLESGTGKTPFQPATQSIYTLTENETPAKEIIHLNIDNMLCPIGRRLNAVCPNHNGKCSANIPRNVVIGNEGRSAEAIARKIANDPTPIVVGQFTSDGDSAGSVGFERGQRIHSQVPVENLRCTRHLSDSHRKVVKNITFSKGMFPGKNQKERDKVHKRFSIEVAKRCNAEVKLAHEHFMGDMKKKVRKLSYTIDSVIQCVTGACGKLCTKHSFVCTGKKRLAWKAKFMKPGTKLNPTVSDLKKLRECVELRLGPKALMKTRLNTDTQKNESVNRTLTKTNPKFSTWTAVLPGRIHGAVHMRNCGVEKSIRKRCSAAGATLENSGLIKTQLKRIQNKLEYNKDRKKSQEYKDRQSFLRRDRFNMQEAAASKANTGTYQKNILDPEMRTIIHDHSSLVSKKPRAFNMKLRKC